MTQGNNPKFCDQCGATLRETSKFCPECGVLIFKASTQSPSMHPYDAQQEISSRVSDVEVDMERRSRTITAQKLREYGQYKPSSTIWNKMKRLTNLSRVIIITCLLLIVIYMFAIAFTKWMDG